MNWMKKGSGSVGLFASARFTGGEGRYFASEKSFDE